MSTWTGPGRPVRAMWKASARTRGRSSAFADEVVVLGHRQGDAVDVDLLEGVLADQRGGNVAGDGHDRDRIELGRGDARDEVRRAGSGRPHADPDLARDPGVAVGGVGAALLVADEDVAELGMVAEDVVERQDDAARVAEEDVDALPQDGLADDVRPDPGTRRALGGRSLGRDRRCRRALVEHLALGLLDQRPHARVPAAGMWLRRTRPSGLVPVAAAAGAVAASVAAAFGPLADPPFVIVIVRRLRDPGPRRRLLLPSNDPGEMRRPSPPGEGPVGLRWSRALRAPVPPRSSVLPPGAGNEAKKALKADQERANKGEKGYLERIVLDRHLHAAAVARHDDGDTAAVQPVRGTHGSRSLRGHRSARNHHLR